MRALTDVDPTPEQLRILADSGPGFRIIRGAAGSGKTTAALLRLRQLCGDRESRRRRMGAPEPVRALALTFNRTLRGYIDELARHDMSAFPAVDLTVNTFAQWAVSIVNRQNVVKDSLRRSWLQDNLRRIGVNRNELDYFVDEFDYITGRFAPDTLEHYLRIERTGRGRAPAVPRTLRNQLLGQVVEPYAQWKTQNRVIDWNDLALMLRNTANPGYDIVVVDETQDLSANQIRAICSHLKEDHSTTFIIDTAQRIYPQAFPWTEVDIQIRPNMVFPLPRNHRNTKQIARFAVSLVKDLPVEDDGLIPNENQCSTNGPLPQVVVGKYSAQLTYMLDRLQPALASGETVAILQPRGGNWFGWAKRVLSDRDIAYCSLTREADWPTGPELVALCTIHSAKGLEFDHVLIPGLAQATTPHGKEDGDGSLDALRRLLAMGIGRARWSVMVGYKPGEQSTLVGFFDPRTYDTVEV